MKKLHTIVYKSLATIDFSQEELTSLAKTAYFNNFLYQISGLLLYYNQHFFQILEGRQELVEMVFESIKKDARHERIHVIKNEPLSARSFEQWSMGLVVVPKNTAIEKKLFQHDLLEEMQAQLILETFSKKGYQKYIK